jgi:hypothetical protein
VGTFSSFNYQFSNTPPVQQIANQDYTICIRMNQVISRRFVCLLLIKVQLYLSKKQGFCGICYQVCDTPATQTALKKFDISLPSTAGATELGCTTDWIQIPCATDQQSTSQLMSTSTAAVPVACVNKICGAAFSAVSGATTPAPVYSKQFLSLEHFLSK